MGDVYGKYNKFHRIIIKDNCFIGVNSIILPNVTIGPNSVVAGSVVMKDMHQTLLLMVILLKSRNQGKEPRGWYLWSLTKEE
ncbi:acyltransferase [Caloranaerobacter sp. DY30410]|uniref:acyltransferase n=1 Tax=Caloranaerobacter sp. DY30410 TaxID=3238305 RepID=UPI003D056B77